MTVELKDPLSGQPIIDPKTGALTLDGLELLQRLVAALRDHEARIVTLEP